MKPFALLGKLARKYSTMIILTTLTMLGLVGAQLLIPWIIRQLIDRLTTQPLDQGTIDFITRISLIALVVFVARALMQFVRSYAAHIAGWELFRMPAAWFTSTFSGSPCGFTRISRPVS